MQLRTNRCDMMKTSGKIQDCMIGEAMQAHPQIDTNTNAHRRIMFSVRMIVILQLCIESGLNPTTVSYLPLQTSQSSPTKTNDAHPKYYKIKCLQGKEGIETATQQGPLTTQQPELRYQLRP